MRLAYICPQCKRQYLFRGSCSKCYIPVVPMRLARSRKLDDKLKLAKLTGDETLVATLTMERQASKAVRAEKLKELKHKRMEVKLKIWTRKLKLAETKIKKISRWLAAHQKGTGE